MAKGAGESAEKVVKDIRRKIRRRFSAEEKIRIVLEGLRGEESIATLWVKLEKNGPGEDQLREFTLDGTLVNSFSATPDVNAGFLYGLEIAENGNLFSLNGDTHILYEFDPSGSVVGQTQLQFGGSSFFPFDFAAAPNGNIVVAHFMPEPPTALLLAFGLAGLAAARRRRPRS
jgi:hypothetical protein